MLRFTDASRAWRSSDRDRRVRFQRGVSIPEQLLLQKELPNEARRADALQWSVLHALCVHYSNG
jgi:hypothetical protein